MSVGTVRSKIRKLRWALLDCMSDDSCECQECPLSRGETCTQLFAEIQTANDRFNVEERIRNEIGQET